MKTIIIILFLYSITINAQNVWYVDVNSPTAGNPSASNGRSWATAWDGMDSVAVNPKSGINWNVIQGGDLILVKAGTYYNQATTRLGASSITFSTPVHIRPYGGEVYFKAANTERFGGTATATVTNHLIDTGGNNNFFAAGHGMVVWNETDNLWATVLDAVSSTDMLLSADIFQAGDSYRLYHGGRVFYFGKVSNVVFHNFNFVYDNSVRGLSGGVGLYEDSLIVLDSCTIINNGYMGTGLIVLNGYKNTLSNSILYSYENSLSYDGDPIGIGGYGGHTIDHCFMNYNSHDPIGNAHRDMIQISDLNAPSGTNPQTVISNNIIIDQSTNMPNANGFIYQDGLFGNQRFLIYNNIIVTKSEVAPMNPFRMGDHPFGGNPSGWSNSIRILNNTVITKGIPNNVSKFYNLDWADTIIIKNNVFVADIPTRAMAEIGNNFGNGSPAANLLQIDYNFYSELGAVNPEFGFRFGNRTFDYWKNTLGFDAHSDTTNTSNVTWTNKYDTTFTGYYTNVGRDIGIDLSAQYPFLATDIAGNPRGFNSSWDMGALEYQGGQSNNVNVKGKIYLQGPFNSNSMATTLNQGGLVPNSQPYNSDPWYYNGNESFNPGANSTVVDWVLVELRSTSSPYPVVATRAALLKNNGLLLETNGSEGINFPNVNPGSYYIAIFHRNHLAIMSSGPVQLSSNSTLYDFTTSMNKAYGQNSMVQLGTGKYGMFASDGNGDGIIDSLDYNNIYLLQRGSMGYKEGDFNMDSGVTVFDVNGFLNLNNGKEAWYRQQ